MATGNEREEPHGPRAAGEGTADGRADEDVCRHGRRRWLKRGLQASGLAVVGVGAVGIAEADRGDEGGRPLHTEVYGPTSGRAMEAAPTIIFLPGIGATTRYFRRRVQALAANARVVLVDLLGFGQSPMPWATYSVERHVAELHRVLGALGPVTLVGHSLGARIAVAYAARHPAQVRRVILMSIPHFGSGEGARRHFRRRGAEGWFLTHLVPFAIACLLSRRLLGWAFPALMPDLPREVAEDLTRMTWRSSTSSMWQVVYEYDMTSDFERLPASTPVTFIHGDQDESAPLPNVRRLAAARPGSTLRVLPGGDHQLLLGQPAWTLAEIGATMSTGGRGGSAPDRGVTTTT